MTIDEFLRKALEPQRATRKGPLPEAFQVTSARTGKVARRNAETSQSI